MRWGNRVGAAALIASSVIWGFVPVTTREVLGTLAPRHIVLARFLFASIAVLLMIAIARPPLPSRQLLPRAIFFGLLGTLGLIVPLTLGLQHVEAGTGALLNATSPAFTVVLAALLLAEPLRPRVIVGLSLALMGSAVVAAGSGGGFGLDGEQLWGSFLVLLSAIVWAVYSVMVKPWLGPIPPSSIPIVGSLAGLPLVLPFGAAGFVSGLQHLDPIGWVAVVQFALGAAVIAPILFAVGLARTPASRAGMYGYLTPLFGVAAGAALLGETIGPATLAGGVLLLAGVLVATVAPRTSGDPVTVATASD